MDSPSFLWYSKDWLTGTAEMEPEEKGIYVDLLSYQHLNKSLPFSKKKLAKICGLDLDRFLPIWEGVKHKFNQLDNRLVNHKLNHVIEDNKDRALKNRVNGALPRVIEKFNLTKKERATVYKLINSEINYNEFSEKTKEEINQSLNQMVNQTVNYIANEDVNANEKGKEEGKVNIIFPFDSKEFMEAWELWKKFKKQQFNFAYKPIGEQGALKDVSELSNNNEEIAIKIIYQSIKKGWKGFFELKGHSAQDNEYEQFKREAQEVLRNAKFTF